MFLLLHNRKTWLKGYDGVIPPYPFDSNFILSILIPESLCKRENPQLFMLSAKLDPKIYSVDLHFVLYFIEFWINVLSFLTYFNKNDCKPLKMININDQV